MKKITFKFGIMILMFALYGCATPGGMKWQKSGNSLGTTKADISDCKVSTALWWPFDDLSKCMHRRGYKLIGENEIPKHLEPVDKKKNDNYNKLIQLKKMHDEGIITDLQYEYKKNKYLSEY